MNNIKKYYKFKVNNKYGFKDLDNKVIIDFEFDDVTNFINDLVWLKKTNKWFLYNIKDKNELLSCDQIYFFSNEISIVLIKNTHYIFYNLENKKIKINFEVVNVQNNMFIKIKNKEQYNFLDFNLNLVFKNWYDDIDYIEHGYFCTTTKNKKTIINIKEEKVIDNYFEDINIESKDFFKVKSNDKWIFIDKLGGEYDLSKIYNFDFGVFKNLHLNFKAKNKSGFLNQFFEIKFKKKFEICSHVIDGYVIVKKYDRYGVVNMKGRYIIKPIYNFIKYDEKNIFYAERKNCSTYLTTSGTELFKIN